MAGAKHGMKSETVHVRIPMDQYFIINKLADSLGVGLSTQLRILVKEALHNRKLIK